jgi:nuclear GTP-binding protein
MVKGRKSSKRTTLKDKYKIQRRVVQKHRKDRKDAKNGVIPKGKARSKKDPGIPNSWPFKETMLREVEIAKEREEERRKGILSANLQRNLAKKNNSKARTLEELAGNAMRDNQDYNMGAGEGAESEGVKTLTEHGAHGNR